MLGISYLFHREVVADPVALPRHSLVSAANISTPSADDGPPKTSDDTTGYFPYLWCGAGTTTYVFIDPIGKYGQNKGTVQPIFWTGLDGAYNTTQNAMEANRRLNINLPTGDSRIDEPANTPSRDVVLPVEEIAGTSGISEIEVFVQNANHQHLTWGVYASALTIMKDFVLQYSLFADAMYFQISEGDFSTVANGYMGARFKGSQVCYLQGSATQNPAVTCAMPSDYPDS